MYSYPEARELSLKNRRLKLSLQYTVKLKTNPLNPAHACVFHPKYQPLYDSKPTSIRPLSLRVSPHLQGLDNVAFNYMSDTPPWEVEQSNIILELAALRKSDTPPITYHDQYLTIRNRFPRHIPFYTDGSKDTERVSVAAVLINHTTVITFKITVPFSRPKLVPYSSLLSASNTPIGKGV